MYTDAAVEDSCQENSMSWMICTGTGAAAMDSCQTVRYSKYKYRTHQFRTTVRHSMSHIVSASCKYGYKKYK